MVRRRHQNVHVFLFFLGTCFATDAKVWHGMTCMVWSGGGVKIAHVFLFIFMEYDMLRATKGEIV